MKSAFLKSAFGMEETDQFVIFSVDSAREGWVQLPKSWIRSRGRGLGKVLCSHRDRTGSACLVQDRWEENWNCWALPHWLYEEPVLLAQLYRLLTFRWLIAEINLAEINLSDNNPVRTKNTGQCQNDSGFYQFYLIKWFLWLIRLKFQKRLGIRWFWSFQCHTCCL